MSQSVQTAEEQVRQARGYPQGGAPFCVRKPFEADGDKDAVWLRNTCVKGECTSTLTVRQEDLQSGAFPTGKAVEADIQLVDVVWMDPDPWKADTPLLTDDGVPGRVMKKVMELGQR